MLTFTEQYQDMKARADKVRQSVYDRAVKAYFEAFGSSAPEGAYLDMCVIGNSLLDAERGRPWREVNYGKMRLAKRLAHDWRAHNLANAYYTRKIVELRQEARR